MLDMDDHFELWEPPDNLIDRTRLRGIPRHGIGRAMKVSKEQIIALLTALRLFTAGTYDAERPIHQQRLEHIATVLAKVSLSCHVHMPPDGESLPVLEITVGSRAFDICRRLRRGPHLDR
jgi:L-seryl-tRNA(Ser) seleniumtransferase